MSSWFETAADPKVAQAVAEAEAVARKPVDDDPLLARPRTDPGIDQAGASDQPGWQTPAIDPGRVEQ